MLFLLGFLYSKDDLSIATFRKVSTYLPPTNRPVKPKQTTFLPTLGKFASTVRGLYCSRPEQFSLVPFRNKKSLIHPPVRHEQLRLTLTNGGDEPVADSAHCLLINSAITFV
jgi:hypothetical protein